MRLKNYRRARAATCGLIGSVGVFARAVLVSLASAFTLR